MLKQQNSLLIPNGDEFNEIENSWSLNSAYDVNQLKKSPWTSNPIWSNDFGNENCNKFWSSPPSNTNNTSPNNTITSIQEEWKSEFSDCDAFKAAEATPGTPSAENTDPIHDQVVDEKTFMQNMINSTANWGRFPIDQTTAWDLEGSSFDGTKNLSDSNVWESEPPNGTGIWDKHYATLAIGSASGARQRENSVETLAPKSSWNGNNSNLSSCDPAKEVPTSNAWNNKQVNGLTNNFSNLLANPAGKKPAFNNQPGTKGAIGMNGDSSSPTPTMKPSRPMSLNAMNYTSSDNNPSLSLNPSHSQILGNGSYLPSSASFNNGLKNGTRNGKNSSILSNLPLPLNTLISQPPPIQNSMGFNGNQGNNNFRRQMNASNNGSNGSLNTGSFSNINGGSLRADLTKQFISLGYSKDDVQGALINNNMDVERTIGELNDIYPHLTYKAIDHFAPYFNQMRSYSNNFQQQQQQPDWKTHRQLRKIHNDNKDNMPNESLLGSKMMSPSSMGHPYNSSMNSFPFSVQSANAFSHHPVSHNQPSHHHPLATTSTSSTPFMNSNGSEWKNSPFIPGQMHAMGGLHHQPQHYNQGSQQPLQQQQHPQQQQNFNQQPFVQSQENNYWPSNGSHGNNGTMPPVTSSSAVSLAPIESGANSDFMNSHMQMFNQYDLAVSNLIGLAKKYDMIQCLSNQKPSANDSPTNSPSNARELQAKLVQLEAQFSAKRAFLSQLINGPVNCFINDPQSIEALTRNFDDLRYMNNKIPSNPPNTSRIIGNNWSNMSDNLPLNLSDNQFSFNNRSVRNIKLNN